MENDKDVLSEEILAEEDDIVPPASSYSVLYLLQANGWYILISSLLLYYLWKRKISPYIAKQRQIKEEEEEATRMKKDPDFYKAREASRMAAVQRFQNTYDEQAAKMKKIAKEREEKKRQEYISKLSQTSGRRLNEEYNPLMGAGGPRYKPPKRTCPGGSCGNR